MEYNYSTCKIELIELCKLLFEIINGIPAEDHIYTFSTKIYEPY